MLIFETIIILLLGAAVLSVIAKRIHIPYPTLLAIGGACVALLPFPGAPRLDLSPELILALFVAPVLLDAAHDTSLRDLKSYWRPVMSLILFAVVITTIAVAIVARQFFPDMPWPAAIALGALLAPPDAVAAMAVLKQLKLPHRIRTILEGESLLNDASALLIYKLAVGAAIAGSFHVSDTLPVFGLVIFGSLAAGWVLARLGALLIKPVTDAPTSVILQFAFTFGVWMLAEHFGLSAVVTIVVFGLTMAQYGALSARLRVTSFAIWESATFVLNVLAFTLIGLQMRPILGTFKDAPSEQWLTASLVILVVTIAVRLLWVMTYVLFRKILASKCDPGALNQVSAKGGLVVGWSGMRGVVTLAAAMALPEQFPYRDFIQLTAFVVVLGTLVIHGPTLRPLLAFLRMPKDDKVDREVDHARGAALQAALGTLEGNDSDASLRLRQEYNEALHRIFHAGDPHEISDNALRREAVKAARDAILNLRSRREVGDDAYRLVEEELDWFELSATPKTEIS